MRELAVLTFVTLDGVMQSPTSPEEDPSGGFRHGGWAHDCWNDVMEQVGREAMSVPYDLLLGRRTYDIFAAHFPNLGDDPQADRFNKATKYVATSSPETLDWVNSVAIAGDVAAEVTHLKNEDGPLLQVHGSSQLSQTLHVHRLIDEYRIWTFPTVVGSGKRLFGDGVVPTGLELVKSEPAGKSGAVMSIYRRSLASE